MSTRRLILVASAIILFSGFIFFWPQKSTNSTTQPQSSFSNVTATTSACSPVEFLGYYSSDYEKVWEENAAAWGRVPCEHAKDEGVQPLLDYWVRTTQAALADPVQSVKDLGNPFSYFKYRDCEKNEIIVPIEPFALVGRHPYVCVGGNYLGDKNYLLLDRPQTHGKTAKNWYFDLGASTWTSGAGGSSQNWVYESYGKLGIKFDGIYAWEAQKLDLNDVMAQIPQEVKPIYHWFNVPANPEVGHADNPLKMMKDLVKPEDFLVFKLDIDNSPVEEKFIAQIMNDPELSKLIDEMFFEHHINMEPLATCCWGTSKSSINMVDSGKIFLGLRRKGIRMHVWV